MRARRPLALAACLTAAAAVTACASESDSGGGHAAGGVSDHLGRLPVLDGDDPVVVTYADLDRAAEIAGVEPPDDPSDTDAVVDYLTTITGQQYEEGEPTTVGALVPVVSQFGRSADLDGFADDVGWSILEVDSYAERDTPPQRVAVLRGDFDGDRMGETLDEADDGVWVAGNPDGGLDVGDRSPARPIGETLWLALDGDRLTITGDEGDMAPTRDAAGGQGTLADDATFATLGAALDGHDVYTAMLEANQLFLTDFALRSLGPDATPEQLEALGDLPRCEGVTGAAIGLAYDDRPLVVLVMAHVDEASARANADTVSEVLDEGAQLIPDRPWSDLLTVESVEAEGRAVVATARPAADIWLPALYGPLVQRTFPPC